MTLPANWETEFAKRVVAVKRVAVDSTVTDEHSLSELIEADRYVRTCDGAADSTKTPFRLNILKPPGAVT